MTNIYDVAKSSGVSKSTVSRVINGSLSVNEETRKKVLNIMQELNYNPNSAARSLALKKNNTIAVISGYMLNDPFYSKVAEGIYKKADEMGYGTIFCVNQKGTKSNVHYFTMLFGKVDGIIFLGYDSVLRDELLKFLDVNFPVVLFENDAKIPGILEINIDNYTGAYIATKHLIQQGHRKIAHIKGFDYFESRERFKGYVQALTDYNIKFDEKLVVDGGFDFRLAYEMADDLIKKDITAVFCANDMMALGFIKKANELGYKVPDNISVVGFDDISDSSSSLISSINITTIRQPVMEMAEYAVKALIHNIETGVLMENKVFMPILVERESTKNII